MLRRGVGAAERCGWGCALRSRIAGRLEDMLEEASGGWGVQLWRCVSSVSDWGFFKRRGRVWGCTLEQAGGGQWPAGMWGQACEWGSCESECSRCAGAGCEVWTVLC